MKQLTGKRALVTGSASGIGRAIAVELAAAEIHLLLADRDEQGLLESAELVGGYGVDVLTYHYDAAVPAEVDGLASVAQSLPGGIDILVNNAGLAYHGPTARMEVEHWEQMLGVNLHAPVRLTQRLLPTLLSRRDSHVLNICSVLGLVGLPKVCAYSTSKFGLVGFTESLRNEYGPQGMGVTAICPGLVRTNLFSSSVSNGHEKQKTPPKWASTSAEHVARMAVKAMKKNRRLVVVEPIARLTYALKRFAPTLLDWSLHLSKRRQTARRIAFWQNRNNCQPSHSASPSRAA